MKIDKKLQQLGMPIGTASAKLRKSLIFHLIKQLNQHYCFQCGAEIETEKELSIEHKIPYLDSENPIDLFFDLKNIAFSHLSCNCGAGSRATHKHPSERAYYAGCRCDECKEIQKLKRRKTRAKQNPLWRNGSVADS